MTTERLPSNIVQFAICTANTTSPQICTSIATSAKAEKRSKINLVGPAPSRPGITDPHVVSLSRANAALLGKEFLALVNRLSAMELIDRFPLDYSSFKDMKGRRRNGCEIAPEFRVFRSFLRHMKSARPSPEWTLDRINPFRKEYGPGLCRWASKDVQANNRTDTIMLTGPDGRTLPLTEWAKITGQSADTIRARIRRGGWTHLQAITGIREERSKPVDHVEPQAIMETQTRSPDEWPEGLPMVTAWEAGYLGFRQRFPEYAHPTVTRAVFLAWIVTNALRGARKELQWEFPTYDVTEYMREPEGYAEHQTTKLIARLEQRFVEAWSMIGSDKGQQNVLHGLVQKWPNIISPQRAATMIRREYEE